MEKLLVLYAGVGIISLYFFKIGTLLLFLRIAFKNEFPRVKVLLKEHKSFVTYTHVTILFFILWIVIEQFQDEIKKLPTNILLFCLSTLSILAAFVLYKAGKILMNQNKV